MAGYCLNCSSDPAPLTSARPIPTITGSVFLGCSPCEPSCSESPVERVVRRAPTGAPLLIGMREESVVMLRLSVSEKIHWSRAVSCVVAGIAAVILSIGPVLAQGGSPNLRDLLTGF